MKKLTITALLLIGLLIITTSICAQRSGSQINKVKRASNSLLVTPLNKTIVTPEILVQAIIGASIVPSNVVYSGADSAAGLFSGGSSIGLGLDNGAILSSGLVNNIYGPNELPDISGEHFTPGDSELEAISGQETYDAAILEFDFVPTDPKLEIRFIFGSDEYNEYVDDVNDVFAFFLDGVNIALVPGTTTPILINTVNNGYADEWMLGTGPCTNCQYYVDNSIMPNIYVTAPLDDFTAPYDTEMDGFTTLMTGTADVIPGNTHHIKIAIADATDEIFDSWVLIEGNSFGPPPSVPLSDWAIYIVVMLIGIAIFFRFKTKIA